METKVKSKNNQWREALDKLAAPNSAAVIVLSEDSSVVYEANNNSICKVLYSSENYASECEKFCGRAFEMAQTARQTIQYQCYAGLDCFATPIINENKMEFVSIVGRAFTKTSNYREATKRALNGDWKSFAPTQFFDNVLLKSDLKDIEIIAEKIKNFDDVKKNELLKFSFSENNKDENSELESVSYKENKRIKSLSNEFVSTDNKKKEISTNTVTERVKFLNLNNDEIEELAVWRSHFNSLFNLSYKQACQSILDFISLRYSLNSLGWSERIDKHLIMFLSKGKLKNQHTEIKIAIYDELIKNALQNENSVEIQVNNDSSEKKKDTSLQLFPIAPGGEIRGGLILDEIIVNEKLQRQIARFCRNVAPELEILRLREELSRRNRLERAVKSINDSFSEIDTEDFWIRLTQILAELLRSERSSLLLFEEKEDKFSLKAAIGNNAEVIRNVNKFLGERVSRKVLSKGKPLVIVNTNEIGLQAAPSNWNYKTNSFISYPLTIGARKVGVLNLTDKADGESYNKFDLQTLDSIMPQVAVLIDRATLKLKAGQFEQLSVTDVLTGLLNRRYLEERIGEEIKRSNREGFPMSFMMIDVDDFKSYNDNFSHPEGDKALKLVAKLFKETLRGADVAARYGGEEFSILLPQTTMDEAKIIAERIRENVEKANFDKRQITVSIGVASCSRIICNAEEIISAADKALYQAKSLGRNNVQTFVENSVEYKKWK